MDKVDEEPISESELDTEIAAAEWNAAMDAIVEIAAALGVEVDPAAGSIEDLLRALNAPTSGRDRWAFVEDFFALPASWTASITSAGTATLLDAADADADSGVGWYKLAATASGDAAILYHTNDFVRGDHAADFRARVKLTGTMADIEAIMGLRGSGGSSYAWFITASGNWSWAAESASGSADNGLTGVAVTAGWHDFRIVIDPAVKILFYIDDTLVATADADPDAAPSADDRLSPFFSLSWVANSGGAMVVDSNEVTGLRN